MKAASPSEIDAIRKRALKSFAMGRIGRADCDGITSRCDELDVFIQRMDEIDPERTAL